VLSDAIRDHNTTAGSSISAGSGGGGGGSSSVSSSGRVTAEEHGTNKSNHHHTITHHDHSLIVIITLSHQSILSRLLPYINQAQASITVYHLSSSTKASPFLTAQLSGAFHKRFTPSSPQVAFSCLFCNELLGDTAKSPLSFLIPTYTHIPN